MVFDPFVRTGLEKYALNALIQAFLAQRALRISFGGKRKTSCNQYKSGYPKYSAPQVGEHSLSLWERV
ncbi:MAG: hypothetical protein ACOCX4_05125, partial [Planctomycetota bacterium]